MQHFASCSSLIFLILLSAGADAEEAITMQWQLYDEGDSECSGGAQISQEYRFLSSSSMCCANEYCRSEDYFTALKVSTTCQDGKVVGTLHSCSDTDCSNCTNAYIPDRPGLSLFPTLVWNFTSENIDKNLAGECRAFNETNWESVNEMGLYIKITANKMKNVCEDAAGQIPVSACKKTTTSGVGFIFSSVLVFRTLVLPAMSAF